MSAQRRAALIYAAMNMDVFPCRSGAKAPATRAGFHNATTDYDQIKEWWNRNPDYNVGVRPWSDCAVIDVDVSGDKTGNASLEKLIDELGPLPDTWVARTASGGRHIWLRIGDDLNGRSVNKSIAPFIDIKVGRTGYVIAPPSRTLAGTYQWLDADQTGMSSHHLPAAAPGSWRDKILKPVRPQRVGPPQSPAAAGENPAWVQAAVDGELTKLAGATPHGGDGTGRNDTLHAVSCRLFGLAKGGHVDREAAESEMRRIAIELGMRENEISAVLTSAWRRTCPEHPPVPTPIYTLTELQ